MQKKSYVRYGAVIGHDAQGREKRERLTLSESEANQLDTHELNKLEVTRLMIEVALADSFDPNPLPTLERAGWFRDAAALPDCYDIPLADRVVDYFNCFTQFDRWTIRRTIRGERDALAKKANKPKRDREIAEADDFFRLFEVSFRSPVRSIFSGDLLSWDNPTKLWVPSIERMSVAYKDALELEQETGMRFPARAFDGYFRDYQDSKPLTLPITIPQWDGTDRLSQIASCVMLDAEMDHFGISQKVFEDFLKDWFSRMFQRLHDPDVQNRILVLKGPQGAGKDFLVNTLVNGLGQFACDVSLISGDKDTQMQLHYGLVLKISEFDKTARTEVSVLKDLITKPRTNIRAPYDRAARPRDARCSFIATCNVDDILRDSTGNRRFLIFTLDKIKWAYPTDHASRLQILAQGQALAAQRYAAREESETAMKAYIGEHTPIDVAVELREDWETFARERLESLSVNEQDQARKRGYLTYSEALPALQRLQTIYKYDFRKIKRSIHVYRRKNNSSRGFAWTLDDPTAPILPDALDDIQF